MMRRVVIALVVGCCAQVAMAQQPAIPSLAASVREAGKTYQPLGATEVPRSKAAAEKAMGDLDSFLKTGAKSKSDGWKRYLHWDQLTAGIKDGQPGIIATVVDKLRANQTGLERPE